MRLTIKQTGVCATVREEGMTLDRQPDLDNANVGMPENKAYLMGSCRIHTVRHIQFLVEFQSNAKSNY